MSDTTLPSSMLEPRLESLQETLDHEIPMCSQMGIRVVRRGPEGLVVRLPLDGNHNHQQTAFAGSLNALCTIAGWSTVFLMLQDLRLPGTIVIRRSSIKYHLPVASAEIYACCEPVSAQAQAYFVEMLAEKGQGKLDLLVSIAGDDRPAVTFSGSYVVLDQSRPLPTDAAYRLP